MQRADTGIPTPRENRFLGAAHADELVIDQVRRHPDQRQAFALLADNLVAGGVRDKVGETLESDGIAITNGGFHGFR